MPLVVSQAASHRATLAAHSCRSISHSGAMHPLLDLQLVGCQTPLPPARPHPRWNSTSSQVLAVPSATEEAHIGDGGTTSCSRAVKRATWSGSDSGGSSSTCRRGQGRSNARRQSCAGCPAQGCAICS